MLLACAPAVSAQQCLHGPDESISERRRRQEAVEFVGRVIAAERAALEARGSYVPLTEAVPAGDVPLGFVPRLTSDQWSYAISLKDLFDPCGFALFSDQDGEIYEGHPAVRPDAPSAGQQGTSGPGSAAPPEEPGESRD